MKLFKFATMFGILICLGSVSLMAQDIRVGGWSLRANGNVVQGFHYTGSCPVDLKFGWGVISNRPREVGYRFERSDGGHSSRHESVNLQGHGHSTPVYYDWQLGAHNREFANFHGWVNLIIEGREPVEKKIDFTIHCR